jgi:hypothetical protein
VNGSDVLMAGEQRFCLAVSAERHVFKKFSRVPNATIWSIMFQTSERLLILAVKLNTKIAAILLTVRQSAKRRRFPVLQQNRPFCFSRGSDAGAALQRRKPL